MKDEQTGLMEEEIAREDKLAQQNPKQTTPAKTKPKAIDPQAVFARTKKIILGIKRPKILTLTILFAVLLTAYTALALLASKKEPPPIAEPQLEIASPTPKQITDPRLLEIADNIEEFKTELEKQEKLTDEFLPPIIDLNISFK